MLIQVWEFQTMKQGSVRQNGSESGPVNQNPPSYRRDPCKTEISAAAGNAIADGGAIPLPRVGMLDDKHMATLTEDEIWEWEDPIVKKRFVLGDLLRTSVLASMIHQDPMATWPALLHMNQDLHCFTTENGFSSSLKHESPPRAQSQGMATSWKSNRFILITLREVNSTTNIWNMHA